MQLIHEPPPKRVAIVAHARIAGAEQEARKLAAELNAAGITTAIWSSLSDETLARGLAQGEFDILMALGGDGTMLHAGRLCGPFRVPVLGVNLGRFGFLAEVKRGEWSGVLPDLISGHYRQEERMMIRAEHRRGDQTLQHWDVLNEVVVCRGHFIRPIALQASVDGYVLATYIADGLIAATPTGSTAYALAAGGPILPPEMRNILIVPVAPHLSVDRAVVLSEGTCVTFKALANHEVVASADGQDPVSLQEGDEINVVASSHTARFIRFQDPGYFYRNLTQFMEQNPAAGSAS
jgi:NAD+ kinase